MDRTPDEIEATLSFPTEIVEPMFAVAAQQDAERGDWPSPREVDQPAPPWPDQDSPVLRYLMAKAQASIEAGMEVRVALIQLAVHAWFEGGIENYDRGQRDARRPRPV